MRGTATAGAARSDTARSGAPLPAVVWLLRLLTAAGLAVDAYVHADLAANYDPIRQSISQGDLFRIEAGVASAAALLILLTASRVVWAVVFLIAASALGAILLYRYVNVGTLGPLPNMYEPIWFTKKVVTVVAEGVATATALLGFAVVAARGSSLPRRTSRPASRPD
jgi:hypothetical protein